MKRKKIWAGILVASVLLGAAAGNAVSAENPAEKSIAEGQPIETPELLIDGGTAEITEPAGEVDILPDDQTVQKVPQYEDQAITEPDSAEQQTVSVTVLPTASAITYGQTLEESRLTGGEANVPGTFSWKEPETLLAVADSDLTECEVIFTPDDTSSYEPVSFTLTVTVNKADAVVITAPVPVTES